MSTIKDSQHHQIKDLASAKENIHTLASSEATPLIRNERQNIYTRMRPKFHCRRQRCCVSSKAAILILLWNLILVAGLEGYFDPNFFRIFFATDNLIPTKLSIIIYSIVAFLFLFYPLAGCLADIRWGRYKTVVYSVRIIWGSAVAMVVLGGLAAAGILIHFAVVSSSHDTYPNTIQFTMIILVGVAFGIPAFIAFLFIICGLVCFSANAIQYGMDQLHDAPMEDSVLYIHWYVWTSYAGLLPMEIGFNIISDFLFYNFCLTLLPLLLLGVTLCIQRYKRQWFLTDTGSKNPYKLVYRVLKFAKDHTNPIRRSAFTYCEDELPSRLDLGKEKYGGPFTTEQVEDVKAFSGILRVLLALAPIMMVDFSIDGIMGRFAGHLDGKSFEHKFDVDTLTPLMTTFLIPIYLCLLRPFIQNYIPGILKRIGLGMIFILLSILCTSVMDAYGHIVHANVTACFLYETDLYDYYFSDARMSLDITSYWLVIQYSLNAVGYMLLYIAVYEFICSQSPHAMKGLVIGTFFAIKGVFQLLGVVIIYLPFAFGWNIVRNFPSCGFVFYLINAIIALIGIVAYTCVARQYQYRVRDEPDNIYRYAEEYYANAQDEPNYDYDDYDNLDVHTIDNN